MKNYAEKIYGIDDSLVKDAISREGLSLSSSNGEYVIFPGFCDVHVHLREPGFSYKETVKTGTLACAHGGYTSVCTMPNLSPVPDCAGNLKVQLDIIKKDACIGVYPFGAISVGEKGEVLSKLEEMSDDVIGFSDDGKGVQDEKMMEEAMIRAKSLGKIISAHCEVNELLKGGYIHDGEYARIHGHKGICSESEYAQIERDLFLAKKTGVSYHVCHISAKESVDLIRKAKLQGVDVTCETGPHYLVLCDEDLKEDGFYKMNPPLRSKKDREALIEGLLDGTVDMIATDHAPHSLEEKTRGLEKSLMGIVGIETAFPVLYTELVKKDILSLEKLIELLCFNPRKRFRIQNGKDFTVFELGNEYMIEKEKFLSMGRATPFDKKRVYGKCILTNRGGKNVYSEKNIMDI